MVTLLDIAKICGTSTATVSYVLSGKGLQRRISPATQERILKAAEQLGYVKADAGRAPSVPRVEIHWPTTQLEMTIPPLMNGINAAIASESLPVDVNIRFYEPGHIESQTTLWTPGDNIAAILVAAAPSDLNCLSQRKAEIPVVLLNRTLPGYSYVSIDHEEAGRMAVDHAVKRGGGDIALILTIAPLYGYSSREQSMIRACREFEVDTGDRLFYCVNQIDDGYELGWRLVREGKLHKVLVCTSDMVGLGIISALNEAGIQVGRDVELLSTSHGLSRLFARCYPPMTVVDLKMEEITQRCVRLAIDLATRRTQDTHGIIIHPAMIYRQSSPVPELV